MLIEFYEQECPHCLKVAPLVERLKKEAGVVIEQYEVWHNKENLKKMQGYDKGVCGGESEGFLKLVVKVKSKRE